ncbi:MAG: hypothetical protein A3H69_02415 [Candidatus Sungbacteria bacterium RIFCSPLOWO2_02_FULL_47_9]|uniref:Uncharacterized protein n=2 Tax=Parcubacteria group TaxID=1794811 RepID=A0A1G2RPW3_9BACT|nr:MAG: hypothetical protein UX72_C0003G0066 [Parcubacteria group bacterium GW2011_GWA2_47_10]OGZ93999.1 MAG: hypothetical protein A2633_00980 [Candidatus Sungbacteria bacterium RIFCSPHIGHO2_01_FULL_47_32]OHA11179.1 MAG: hypothetical protein A3H69_02415 [Candidatus Sungbacteria bacterium RIFCSPLOWO2_02_FULL_47_9]OHA74886.1 MAG: hypothetical protein A3A32_03495 [Candidatus Wildermuthbacteria bacterium RIFCSPLOWO2_01_FULL_48_35]
MPKPLFSPSVGFFRKDITNICSVGIIYNSSNPRQVFLDVKNSIYPVKIFRNMLCPIGGNWIGEDAKADRNTRDTFLRELEEELSLDKKIISTAEAGLLGMKPERESYQVAPTDVPPTDEDRKALQDLKQAIKDQALPFRDYENIIPNSVLLSADPESRRETLHVLSSYWLVPLPQKEWFELAHLQSIYGNLSNESVTWVISLPVIIKGKHYISWGHDRVFKSFFLCHGLSEAKSLPLVRGIESIELGPPLSSYAEYNARYRVLNKPAD